MAPISSIQLFETLVDNHRFGDPLPSNISKTSSSNIGSFYEFSNPISATSISVRTTDFCYVDVYTISNRHYSYTYTKLGWVLTNLS